MRVVMNTLGKLFAKSPDKGAETSIYLAASAEVEGVSGNYFSNKKAVDSSQISYDVDIAKQLWTLSENMVQSTTPA